jgi:histidinol-phosphate aminotransferase
VAEKTSFVPPARKAITDPRLHRPDWSEGGPRDPRLLWLDKNENTDPAFQAVVSKALSEMDPRSVATYPDSAPLYRKLSEYLGVDPRTLALASGSDGVIGAVFRAFVEPGDVVLHTSPTYAMYPVYCRLQEAKPFLLEYEASDDGPLLSPETVLTAIRERRPKLICLPNPDSPTGTVQDPDALRRIVACALEVDAMILIDEAYHPFYPHSALPWVSEFPNLIVARTFSKAWGLTGVRLGYGIASPEVASLLKKVRANYDSNTVAVALALRMITDFDAEMKASVERLNRGRDFFVGAMKNLGLRTIAARGNFCHVAFGPHAERVHAVLSDVALYRRDCDDACLKGFSRFSATTTEVYKPVIERVRGAVQTPA